MVWNQWVTPSIDPAPFLIEEGPYRISWDQWIDSGMSDDDVEYNLAQWRPRDGYSNNEADYRMDMAHRLAKATREGN